MPNQTALLIFIKYPTPGTVKTRLAKSIGDDNAAQLYRVFAETCLRRYRQVPGTDCIVYFTPKEEKTRVQQWLHEKTGLGGGIELLEQPNGDLGERLRHAFQQLLNRYSRVIALGTDSPDLPPHYITSAVEYLQKNDAVAGPAEDGGYYLIGLSKYLPELFKNIAWSTPDVLPETMKIAGKHNISIHLLPQWYDVDTAEDLQRLLELGDEKLVNAVKKFGNP